MGADDIEAAGTIVYCDAAGGLAIAPIDRDQAATAEIREAGDRTIEALSFHSTDLFGRDEGCLAVKHKIELRWLAHHTRIVGGADPDDLNAIREEGIRLGRNAEMAKDIGMVLIGVSAIRMRWIKPADDDR